jgi:hypothetical protein
VARKDFKSGREHYELAGRAEGRQGFSVPADWNEEDYLGAHPDVAAAIARGTVVSGYHHYVAAGRVEGRLGGFRPKDWDEAGYFSANPDVRARVALGHYRSGYVHYAAVGKREGRVGGFPTISLLEKLRLRWPALNSALFQVDDVFRMVFSATAVGEAVATAFRQSEPADFDDTGMRVWEGQIKVIRKIGGNGAVLYGRFKNGQWRPWLFAPKFVHCFSDPYNEATAFDPFRFMVRRAYAEGTDLRMFVTPAQTAIRRVFIELRLGNRYEYWLKEIVRINDEEAARAGKQPLPLWDFSAPSTITSEAIPVPGDLTPMRWYWEYSHYRKETGDLILDRIFDHRDPSRAVPDDFGVRLTGSNIDAHLDRSRTNLAHWVEANPELVSQIVAGIKRARTNQPEAACW